MRDDRSPVENVERFGKHDQGDRTPVPDLLAVRPRMPLEQRPLVDVQVPVGDADGEVAERVGGDVDAAGKKTVALHRGEGSIVADDLGDRIRPRHVASSSASYDSQEPARGREALVGWVDAGIGAESVVPSRGHSRTLARARRLVPGRR